jgi:hypothetical protein
MTADAFGTPQRSTSTAQLRIFALLSILYAAITVAVIPWAREPGPADPQIVVVYGIGIVAALAVRLTLARSIVERHGGSIEAHSAGSGKGSEFVVRLPQASPPVVLKS